MEDTFSVADPVASVILDSGFNPSQKYETQLGPSLPGRLYRELKKQPETSPDARQYHQLHPLEKRGVTETPPKIPITSFPDCEQTCLLDVSSVVYIYIY